MAGDKCNGIHHYTCYGYRQRGKSFCDRNTLRQADILDGIVAALEQHCFNEETIARIRKGCQEKLLSRGDRSEDTKRLKASIRESEARLSKAKKRLVEVDADMIPLVQEQIREIQAELKRLETELRAASRSQRHTADEIAAKVDEALKWFGNLKEAARRADAAAVRRFLNETIDHVVIETRKERWTDKRFKYFLAGGEIHLKDCNLLSTAH
jgi:chromosome segregation ATPase